MKISTTGRAICSLWKHYIKKASQKVKTDVILTAHALFFLAAPVLQLCTHVIWKMHSSVFEVRPVVPLVNWICSSVAISNIRSVSNRSDVSIRFKVRWHSQNVHLDSLGSWSSHNYLFFKPLHSFLQNAWYRSLDIYICIKKTVFWL